MLLTCTRTALIFPRLCVRLSTAAAQEKFSEHGVVSDVVQKAPKDLLKATFVNHSVNLGNELTAAATTTQPTLDWPAESNTFYTVAMVDPDAPSRKKPSAREFRHWLVVNVKGKDITAGRTSTVYQGPSPPKDSGLHRYVLLVYKQKDQIMDTNCGGDGGGNDCGDDNRGNWSVAKFADKHQLDGPVAGNFFQVKG